MSTTLPSCSDASARAEAIAQRCEKAALHGDSWQAHCPSHDDANPSLSIAAKDGKVLLHCFAGCAPEAVVAALGLTMAELFVKGPAQSNRHKRIEKVYDYYDAQGTLVHETVRYADKSFRQRRPDPANPAKRIWNIQGITLVLYHLPQVLQAVRDGKLIYLCEGEKDVENLQWFLGTSAAATCNPMGAGKWRRHYGEWLRDAYVVILPDNDDVGKEHAATVADALHGIAASLKVVELSGVPEKGDVSDWLAQGHTRAELEQLVEAAPLWAPESVLEDAHRRRNGQTQDAGREPADLQQAGPSSTSLADEDYPYGDAYNALALVRAHGHNLRYCTAWKSWLTWTETHWQRDTTGLVLRWQRQTVQALGAQLPGMDKDETKALLAHIKSSLNTTRLKAAIEQAHSWEGMSLAPEAFDTDVWLLNCANGTVDLRAGAIRSHRQDDLITKCLPIAYKPDAQCPTWERFLWRIMGGSQDKDTPDMSVGQLAARQAADDRARALISFLQRAIGYSLTGSTREQCVFILHGPTKTGKSTFLGTLRALLGPYARQADMESFMHKDRQEVRNDLADLAGSRFVCALESQEGRRLAESLIKQMTGGVDHIKARFLFQEYFEYQPQFKVFLGTNHKPVIKDTDSAIWERIRLVPFTVQIPKPERDKTLDEQLQKELPGILAWAVKGCLEWQHLDELGEPEAVSTATANYRSDMDIIARFLEECCITDKPDIAKVKASALARAYQAWCKRTGEVPLANRALITDLEERGYTRKLTHANQYYWHGLGLVDIGEDRQE